MSQTFYRNRKNSRDELVNICLLSPYHGGSHKAWAQGYREHSRHRIRLLTLPPRFWKWRMHGGAITLARTFLESAESPDLILSTDMLDLSLFLGSTRRQVGRSRVALYMHENQLTYPLPSDPQTGPMRRQKGERDLHYAFINLASMLVADRVFFNSRYHLESWFDALPSFLRGLPELKELETIPELRQKSRVLPVGIDLKRLDSDPAPSPSDKSALRSTSLAPLILWNHRWEFDKDPEAFFTALLHLEKESLPFRLAVCGQSFSHQSTVFDEAQTRFSSHLIHFGFAPEQRYRELLLEADITVSTARHEFFGIGILEAVYSGAFPILPARLSYPELLGDQTGGLCFYEDPSELVSRLRWAVSWPAERARATAGLRKLAARFDWTELAPRYDAEMLKLCG